MSPPPVPSSCPKCGRALPNWSWYQYLGHLSRHSPRAYHLTPEDRRRGTERGFAAFARRHAGGDLVRAGEVFSAIGRYVTDPAPWNGAYRLPHSIQPEVRERLEYRRKLFYGY